jgi:hypothetical protein
MIAGHEMRRVQEIYPSFDTRRVLCKQQRNHRVKPMRAGRKPRNASSAGSVMSVAGDPKRRGSSRNTALMGVLTKTSAGDQSTGAWSAMSRSGLGSRRRQSWPEGQKVLLAHGENITGLKPNQRHHPDGYGWKKRPNGRKRRLLCGSKRRGLNWIGRPAGQNTRNTGTHWRVLLITKTTNKINKGQESTQKAHGKNEKKMRCGGRNEKITHANIAVNTQKDAKNNNGNGGGKTLTYGSGFGKGRLREGEKIRSLEPLTTCGSESERCLKARERHVQRLDALVTSSCCTSNPSSQMQCAGTITERIGI